MNYIRLLYLRHKERWIAAQFENAAQLELTYGEERKMLERELRKVQRHIFQIQPVKEVTQ